MVDGLILLASDYDITAMLSRSVFWTSTWLPITILATMTAILFNIIFLMFARAFSMEALERYAKSEMLQAGATFLMAVFLVTMLYEATSSEFLQGFIMRGSAVCGGEKLGFGGTEGFGMGGALDLVRCRISEKAEAMAKAFEYAHSDHSEDFDRLTLYISLMGVPVFQGNYVSSWYYTVEKYRLLSSLSMNLLISLNAQLKMVDYVSETMLRFFLPVGIILRAFPFTRGIGALFISLAIGLYFVYPTIFMVSDPSFVAGTTGTQYPPVSAKSPDCCYPTFTGAVTLVQTAGAQSGGGHTGGYGMDVSKAVDNVADAYAGILLHPFIALSITLVFVRYLIYIFGGQPYDVMRFVAKVV